MSRSQKPSVILVLVVGFTLILISILAVLYLSRFSKNIRSQFAQRAILSAQIFAESLPLNAPKDQLQAITQAFVQGDVLYAQAVRGGEIQAEDRAQAAWGLELPVDPGFAGVLVLRERKLSDGTPYLEVMRPFTGESLQVARTRQNYVRVGISLREVRETLREEFLLVAEVGMIIVLAVGLIGGMVWVLLRVGKGRSVRQPGSLGWGDGRSTRPPLQAGPLVIDSQSKEVRLWDERVSLSPKEYELIHLLASEPGRVFSTHEILERVWPQGYTATAKDVKQYIYLLRKKLEPDPKRPQLIVTVRGFGYKLSAHLDEKTHSDWRRER